MNACNGSAKVFPELLLFVWVIAACPAATIVVDGSGGGDFMEIQKAVDAAKDGDTVLVKPGEYVIEEPIDFNRLHEPQDPASPPVKDIVVRSEGGPESTTIQMAETPVNPGRRSVVIFESGETSASLLEGFTLTGGKGSLTRTDESYLRGGGIVFGKGSSPTVAKCTISGNTAPASGGGVLIWDSSPTLRDCEISGNQAPMGGGLHSTYWSRPKLIRCRIEQNGGGGLHSEGLLLEVEDCVFTGNSASDFGGGGARILGGAVFTNCVFAGNRASAGGAVQCAFSRVDFRNCTFHANRATGRGGGIFCSIEGEVTVTNSILWDDAAVFGNEIAVEDEHYTAIVTINASDIDGGKSAMFVDPRAHAVWGVGNIEADPAFAAPGFWDDAGTPEDPTDDRWIVGNYRLQPDSPAIDAGSSQSAPPTDIEGHARPCGEGIDMGAYEFGDCAAAPAFRRGDANGDGKLDLSDPIAVLGYLFLGVSAPPCLDAADVDDSAKLDLTDAIYSLSFQFLGGPPPASPFPGCGVDPTPDDLGCEAFQCQ